MHTNDVTWWDALVAREPLLYHVAPPDRIEQILASGLWPASAAVASSSAAGVQARPGCVYLGSATLWRAGWLHEWTSPDNVSFAIPTAALDPTFIWPDEDVFTPMTGPAVDPALFGLVPPLPAEDTGLWAARVRLGAQAGTLPAAWAERQAIAYEGVITAVELVANPAAVA